MNDSVVLVRDATSGVKQTAALCLLKLVRTDPKCFSHKEYGSRICQLLNDRHLVSACVCASTVAYSYCREC